MLTNIDPGSTEIVPPTVNTILEGAQTITGQSRPGFAIKVTDSNGKLIGSGTAGDDGKFSISVPQQVAGSTVSVTATSGKTTSDPATASVEKDTSVRKPRINLLTTDDQTIRGLTSPNADVSVYLNGDVLAFGTSDSTGAFAIPIPKQVIGTTMQVTAEVNNIASQTTDVTLRAGTAPTELFVNNVYTTSTSVTGQADPGAEITVSDGTDVIAIGTADSSGKFTAMLEDTLPIGTKLTLTSKLNGVPGQPVTKTVTARNSAPVLKPVTTLDTVIHGTAAPASVVKLYDPNDKLITQATTNGLGNFTLTLPEPLPEGEEYYVTATQGNSVAGPVAVNVTKATRPSLDVTPVTNSAVEITGNTAPGANISAKVGNKTYTGVAGSDGKFSIPLTSAPAIDDAVSVTATVGGVESLPYSSKVVLGAPLQPKLDPVTTKTVYVTGITSPNTTVTMKNNANTYTVPGKSDANGRFSLQLPDTLPANTTVTVEAFNSADTTVGTTLVTSADKPAKPVVTSKITPTTTTVTGIADPNADIVITRDGNEIGRGTANDNGEYTVTITAQPAGANLQIVATRSGVSSDPLVTKVAGASITVSDLDGNFDGSPAVFGTVTAGVTKMTLSVNGGTPLEQEITDGTFEFDLDTPLSTGDHLTVTVMDDEGNQNAIDYPVD